MDFKQLQSFISVVRCKSFTEAAEELGISQPTISTHIRILEEELNSRLIVRTAKSFEVTPRGTELFECAQNILKLRDDMINRWNGHDSKVIRLGVSTIPSAYILPEVLPTFGKSHEDIYFVVTQSDSRGIIDAVHKGSYDLGLVGMKTDDEQLVFKKFYQDHLVLIAPVNDHFLEMKDTGSFSLEEVLQEQPVHDCSRSRSSVENITHNMQMIHNQTLNQIAHSHNKFLSTVDADDRIDNLIIISFFIQNIFSFVE